MTTNISYEKIKLAFEKLGNYQIDSYLETYPEFIKYFKTRDRIERHHLIIASHFVYGWMPTIIKLNTKEIDKVLQFLNAAKAGQLLNESELGEIKNCINNSMVGASKLLHFINPNVYAIWDSRIFRYLTQKKSSYGIDKPGAYLEYLSGLLEVTKHDDFSMLHSRINGYFKTDFSPMRAIEIVMFETDKKSN